MTSARLRRRRAEGSPRPPGMCLSADVRRPPAPGQLGDAGNATGGGTPSLQHGVGADLDDHGWLRFGQPDFPEPQALPNLIFSSGTRDGPTTAVVRVRLSPNTPEVTRSAS